MVSLLVPSTFPISIDLIKINHLKIKIMAGIDALKTLIKFLLVASQKLATADSNQDGKIGWTEGLALIMSVGVKIPGIINQIPEIRTEWKDLSTDEVRQLGAYIANELDLGDADLDKIESIVKRLINGIVDNYILIKDIQALRAA